MEKKKNVQLIVIAVLAFAVLFMSVGFASYAQRLDINGTVNVSAAKWSVHYVTTSYAETTGSVVASAHNLTNTDATFTVSLAKPGDFYEFNANIINDGTFDANLDAITINATSHPCLRHTVTYNGTTYTATNSSITGVTLPKQSGSTPGRHTVKVTVEYIEPADVSQLPSSDQAFTAEVHFDYTQAS